MDVTGLDATVQELFSAGIAPSTQRAYQAGTRRYLTFCERAHIQPPFPVCENIMVRFVAFLYTEKLTGGTVKSYMAAVRHSQISLGLGDPKLGEMTQLEYVMKGLKRKATYSTRRTRLPITPIILGQLKRVWQLRPDQRDTSMLWAAATMCFFGFLRAGEVVTSGPRTFDPSSNLAYGDVLCDSQFPPQFLEVRIKASKTDPFRKGVSVYLGRSGTDICPVAAVLDYMTRRGSAVGPFYTYANGDYLSRERFVRDVRRALELAGLNCSLYCGHSFRIGAATTAARQGIQDSLIKTLGRWESSAYTVYIRTPRETLCSVAKTLGRGQ